MTTTDAANETNEEIWSVALPTGDVRRGTLEQLDEAFQAGQITEHSLVLGPNATEWTRLGDLLGLEMPPATPSYAPPSVTMGPASMRPMMMDLSVLVEAPRPRSRMPLVFGALGGVAAVVAVVAFAIGGAGDSSDATKAAGAAALTATQTATAAPKPPLPAIGDDAVPQRPILNDAQKKALQEADDARARMIKASKPEPTSRGTKSAGVKDSAGFAGAAKPGGKCTCKHGDPLCSCM